MKANISTLKPANPAFFPEGTRFVAVGKQQSFGALTVISGDTIMNGWLVDDSYGFWAEQHRERTGFEVPDHSKYTNVKLDGEVYRFPNNSNTLRWNEWSFFVSAEDAVKVREWGEKVTLEARTRKVALAAQKLAEDKTRLAEREGVRTATTQARDEKKARLLAQIATLQSEVEGL